MTVPIEKLGGSSSRRIEQEGGVGSERVFENAVDYCDWLLSAQLDCYLPNNPLLRYTRGLLKTVSTPSDRYDYTVTVFRGSPNAFVLPNGAIFISDQFLKMTDSEEEDKFGLLHEKIHAEKEHVQDMEVFRNNPGRLRVKILSYIGRNRFHEWEADLRAFDEADKLGINPLGGINLFEKIRQIEQGKASDLTHGSTTNRILNLRGMTYLRDFTSLEKPLTNIPPDIKAILSHIGGAEQSAYDLMLDALERRNLNQINAALAMLTADSALLLLPVVLDKVGRLSESKLPGLTTYRDYLNRVSAYLAQKVWHEKIMANGRAFRPPLSRQQKSFLFHAFLEMTVNGSVASPDRQKIIFDPQVRTTNNGDKWDQRTLGFAEQILAEEDIDELLNILKPEVFQVLGIKLDKIPYQLIDATIDRIGQRQLFVDEDNQPDFQAYLGFASKVSDQLHNLFDQEGTAVVNKDEIIASVIEKLLKSLPEDLRTNFYQEAVKFNPVLSKHIQIEVKGTESIEDKIGTIFVQYRNARESLAASLDHNLIEGSPEMIAIRKQMESELSNLLSTMEWGTPESQLQFVVSLGKVIENKGVVYAAYRAWENILGLALHNLLTENKSLQAKLPNEKAKLFHSLKVAMLLSTSESSVALGEARDDFNRMKSNLSAEELMELYKYISDDEALGKELSTDIKTPYVLNSPGWDTLFHSLELQVLKRAIIGNKPKDQFMDLFERFITQMPYSRYSGIWQIKEEVLMGIFSKYSYDLSDPRDLKFLYFVSTTLEDMSYAVRLQHVLWDRLTPHLSVSEGLPFLKQEVQQRRLMSIRAFQNFVEKRAITHDEIDESRRTMLELLTSQASAVDYGKLVMGEEVLSYLFTDKLKFLLAAIGNGEDDSMMKKYIYSHWHNLLDPTKESIPAGELLDRLERLDAQSKYVLIRDMLTGKNGVLTLEKPALRNRLIDFFLDNYVTATNGSDKNFLDVIRAVMKEAARTARYDLVYFALAPLLQDRILQSPKKIPWRQIIIGEEAEKETEGRMYYVAPDRKRINQLIRMAGGESGKENADDRLSNNYYQKISELLSGIEEQPQKTKLNVTEFILEVAQTLGAPGVRFLQLIGQYIDMPPELEEAFRDVYDKVEGQSKITAQQTILREWPEGRIRTRGLETKLGGGSLMTVFKTLVEEEDRAFKVLNPNALFHTDTTHELLSKVFTTLSQKDSRFTPALTLLDDIREWIKGDISFEGFLAANERFKNRHDGFTKGGRYSIKVPNSFEPETKYFQQEEYIEGKNLTDFNALAAEGHDMKAVISLLVSNFYRQISDGLVHSDIHPGNIRVTPNNQVAFLDRNFFIQLTMQDQFFLFGLSQNMQNTQEALGLCLNYLGSQQERPIADDVRQRVLEQSSPLDAIPDPTNKLLQLGVLLRKENLRFPLKITLLIKDFFYLDRLAKKAGFKDVADASRYTEQAA